MIVEGVKRLQILHASMQGNEDADGEALVELLREIEETLCLVLDTRPWLRGKGWASERLDQLVSQLDEPGIAALKHAKPKKKRKQREKT